MKIAFIVNQFPTLSETFVLNQITGLIERGHEVEIYADQPGETQKYHPDVDKYKLCERTCYIGRPHNRLLRILKLFRLPLANFLKNPSVFFKALNVSKYGLEAKSLRLLYASAHLLGRQAKYDIIHAHFGPNGQKGLFLRDIGVIEGKIVTTFHGYDVSKYIKLNGNNIYKPLFTHGNIFSPISNQMKYRLLELNCDEKKIIIHRVGIDCSKFSFTARHQPENGKVKILTIARLAEKKGIEYGILAVSNLIKIGINVEYNIVGDGPLAKDIQNLIKKLNISNYVKLLGWKQQQEVISIMDNSHIFLAPSITSETGDQEGIPTVIMEAMAMGLPVVSTYHSGIPELVENGVSGFLVPEKNVDALTERLHYLLKHPDMWGDMGRAGRKFVESHYNIDTLNEQLVEIYQNIVHTKNEKNTVITATL
ncbi:MAG: glycosyltransferase [Nostoc sp. LLA-1]|nr:glycosyltransferase [Cyanocohniella sp. LLY]